MTAFLVLSPMKKDGAAYVFPHERITISALVERFNRMFPGAYTGAPYREEERDYKDAACAEFDRLLVASRAQVPHVQGVPVFGGQQQLGVHAVLHHVRRAPLTGDQRLVPKMPEEVIGQVLRPTLLLPAALHLEAVMVQREDPARAVAARGT